MVPTNNFTVADLANFQKNARRVNDRLGAATDAYVAEVLTEYATLFEPKGFPMEDVTSNEPVLGNLDSNRPRA